MDERRQAGRYHWLSEGLESFLDSPHRAIEGRGQGNIINLADRRADRSRLGQLEHPLQHSDPDGIAREAAALAQAPNRKLSWPNS